MKKKILSFFIVISMIFALCACGIADDSKDNNPPYNQDDLDGDIADDSKDNNPPYNQDDLDGDIADDSKDNNPPYNQDDLDGDIVDNPICSHNFELVEIEVEENTGIDRNGLFECVYCGEQKHQTINYEDIEMPIINLTGSIEDVSKTNLVTVGVSYLCGDASKNFDCFATLKVQGSSSKYYPKKNYTIKFYKDSELSSKQKVTLVDEWGKESKYCMKANYVDYSQARNIVSAKLYGQVASTRDLQDEFSSLINGGAIDGYPIIVFLNGNFLGLYTMNIPKDDWLFDMDDEAQQAILMANDWTESTALRQNISSDFVSTGWELEYCSTEDTDTTWVVSSFNEMMNFVLSNDGEDFKNGICNYVKVERAIDNMLYTSMISAIDNTSKNILWVTYDGTIWTPVVYDLDGTWGMRWDGDMNFVKPEQYLLSSVSNGNELWRKLYLNFRDEINSRYLEIRQLVMNYENIVKEFEAFYSKIPNIVRDAESTKWISVPNTSTEYVTPIYTFIVEHLNYLDNDILGYVVNRN